MNEQERAEVDRIASDAESGASGLVHRAASLLLFTAQRPGGDVRAVAAACVAAQPSMAGMLTLEALVGDSGNPVEAIERFLRQISRSADAVAAYAVPLLLLGAATDSAGRPSLTIVTCSGSSVVKRTLLALARLANVRVRCAESRPRLEGAALARDLSAVDGLDVEMFTDAGISTAVPGADALMVGADAVGEAQFVNKAGTAALCALAVHSGVPVYVLAGREKRLPPALFTRVALKPGPPHGILLCGSSDVVTTSVTLCNPYFERIPLGLVSHAVFDFGAVSL